MRYLFLFICSSLLGCLGQSNSDSLTEYEKAYNYCLNNNGQVIQIDDTDVCKYQEVYQYDDGLQTHTTSCELTTFYNGGDCDNFDDEIFDETPPAQVCPTCTPSIGEVYNRQIDDILLKLNNTGYTHKTNGPFFLQPHYSALINQNDASVDTYNLFLDCSGFVGYYVVQGLTPSLFDRISTCYSSSRPLAADFVDTFVASDNITSSTTEAILNDLDNNSVCWGRVPHIKDARPGDIIAYKHPEHIEGNECDNYTITGNTGHVMFIHGYPQESTVHHNEWVVTIADSTTAPHSRDSRKIDDRYVYNESIYGNNHYTAWSSRYDNDDDNGAMCFYDHNKNCGDYVQHCKTEDNSTFHRRCEDYGLYTNLNLYIQTKKEYSPTGVGKGNIYISNDMKHYRVKKSVDRESALVAIGRPIKCANE